MRHPVNVSPLPDDPELLAWFELCEDCTRGFKAWQCAPNPAAWAKASVQSNRQLLAFLAGCRATGPDPQEWRKVISEQLLIIRRICATWHGARRHWESIKHLGYAYEDHPFTWKDTP